MGKERQGIISKLRKSLCEFVVVERVPKFGIEALFMFSTSDIKAWKESLRALGPIKIDFLRELTDEALRKTCDERTEYIESLNRRDFVFILGPNARRSYEAQLLMKQLVVNVNSMSQENLEVLAEALRTIER